MKEFRDGVINAFIYLVANIALVALLLLPLMLAFAFDSRLWYVLYVIILPAVTMFCYRAIKD